MDLIHMANANGMNYILTVMDVFSKYAFCVALSEATAVAVTEALVHHVVPHGLGRPPYWVLDGGSEFKDVLAETVKAWGGVPAVSSPNHPQSHGLIERYNRTISNKIAKLLSESEDAIWLDVMPVAVEMVNNQVQESLTDKDAWLAPSEVWFARNPVLQALPQGKVEPPVGMSQYVKRLHKHWELIKQHVKESAQLYQQRMRQRHRNKENPLRSFTVGDEVTYFKPDGSKRIAKITQKQHGPYRVVEVHESGVDYTVQRVGSRNKKDKLKVHVDHLRKLKRFKEDGGEQAGIHQNKPTASDNSKKYVVQEICGERETSDSQRQYLVRWEGFEDCTWEPEENLSCPEKVDAWTQLSAVKRKSRYTAALRRGIAMVTAECMATCEVQDSKTKWESAVRIIMDLSDSQVEDVIQTVCEAAGITKAQVAAVLASPPCETFSHADATNISRGFNFRQHDNPLKPPRKLTGQDSKQAIAKRETAQNHDKMILKLTQELVRFHREYGGEIVVENPVGSLDKRPFMQLANWLQTVVRHTVMYCAYGYRYMKPTHIWTTLRNWRPEGITGNGKCGGKCGQGERHQQEKRQTFRHWEQIAGTNDRLPAGGKKQIWSLPELLTEEIMNALSTSQPAIEKKYVIDLFAGGESWRGYVYIPVDLRKLIARSAKRNELQQIISAA